MTKNSFGPQWCTLYHIKVKFLISVQIKNKHPSIFFYLSASVFDPIMNLKCLRKKEKIRIRVVLRNPGITFEGFHILATVTF